MSLRRRHATRRLVSAAAGTALPAIPSGSRAPRGPGRDAGPRRHAQLGVLPRAAGDHRHQHHVGHRPDHRQQDQRGPAALRLRHAPLPNLATEWAISPDGLRYCFALRRGVQRAYWSENFKPGLPFSNAAHDADPEVDRLFEAAAVEADEARRRDLFVAFQRRIRADLPSVDLIAPSGIIVAHCKVKNFAPGAEGITGNFADLYIDPREA